MNPDQTAPKEQSDLGPHRFSMRLQIYLSGGQKTYIL